MDLREDSLLHSLDNIFLREEKETLKLVELSKVNRHSESSSSELESSSSTLKSFLSSSS